MQIIAQEEEKEKKRKKERKIKSRRKHRGGRGKHISKTTKDILAALLLASLLFLVWHSSHTCTGTITVAYYVTYNTLLNSTWRPRRRASTYRVFNTTHKAKTGHALLKPNKINWLFPQTRPTCNKLHGFFYHKQIILFNSCIARHQKTKKTRPFAYLETQILISLRIRAFNRIFSFLIFALETI